MVLYQKPKKHGILDTIIVYQFVMQIDILSVALYGVIWVNCVKIHQPYFNYYILNYNLQVKHLFIKGAKTIIKFTIALNGM